MARGRIGLAALALVGLSQHAYPGNGGKKNSTPTAPPAISWQLTGQIVLPFDYFQQHIYVPVVLNGKPGFFFMLDTGANRNILNLRTSRQIGIKPHGMTVENKIGFGSGSIYVAPEEHVGVAIGAVPVASVLSVMDLSRVEQHFGHSADGMLGTPFLRHFVVQLDFQHKLLTLLPAEHYRYRGLGFQVRLKPNKDFVVIPVTVGSSKYAHIPVDVLVDSGSNMTLLLYRPYVKALKLQGDLDRAQPGRGFGLNGYYPIAAGFIDSLRIGGAETDNLPVDFLEKEEQLPSTRNIPGAIGNGILHSFRTVIFDVPHQRMIFEVPPPPWQPGVERIETPE